MGKKYETMGAAFGTAAKAGVPVVVGALGAAAGAVGLRWIAARYAPKDYAQRRWLAPTLGVGGAFIGASLVAIPLVDLKTKSGREKAYKATLPLVALGGTVVAAIVTLGPWLWYRFRASFPNVARALVPPPANMMLPASTSTAAAAGTAQSTIDMIKNANGGFEAATSSFQLRAGGLSPSQWSSLEQRARGLREGATSRTRAGGKFNAITKPSSRWAG